MMKNTVERKLIFKNFQSPGDIVMLTAAIRDLKFAYPDIQVDVRTSAMEIWENNPHLTPLNENDNEVEIFNLEYPLIHISNTGQHHFLSGFRKDIEDKLRLTIPSGEFKGDIHLSKKEQNWMSQILMRRRLNKCLQSTLMFKMDAVSIGVFT